MPLLQRGRGTRLKRRTAGDAGSGAKRNNRSLGFPQVPHEFGLRAFVRQNLKDFPFPKNLLSAFEKSVGGTLFFKNVSSRGHFFAML